MADVLEEAAAARRTFVQARVAYKKAVVKAYEFHSPRKIAAAVSAPGSKVMETQIRRILIRAGLIPQSEPRKETK